MIKVSKEEAKTLHEKYEVPYGENGISIHGKSKVKGKSHYLCESKPNMQYINEIRNGIKNNQLW